MFWWFVPVFAGMVLAIPLSVLTSRSSWGSRARSLGLFLTPEETAPPPELDTLRVRMAALAGLPDAVSHPHDSGLTEIILDPYVNAIHVSLLREKKLDPEYAQALGEAPCRSLPEARVLGEKLLTEGPDALKPQEKILVMSDAETMPWLYRQVWLRSERNTRALVALRHPPVCALNKWYSMDIERTLSNEPRRAANRLLNKDACATLLRWASCFWLGCLTTVSVTLRC